MQPDYDVVIAGGGIVGTAFACALRGSGLRLALVEANDPERRQDGRAIALSTASTKLLSRLGVWTTLQTHCHPIRRVHVSERGRFGSLQLSARELGLDTLGHIVSANRLARVLWEQASTQHRLECIQPARVSAVERHQTHMQLRLETQRTALRCRLLVAADGAESLIRQQMGIPVQRHDYRQSAIVCAVNTGHDTLHTAQERFGKHGLIALLPQAAHSATVVYVTHSQRASQHMAATRDELITLLNQELGAHNGHIIAADTPRVWPLRLLRAQCQVQHRLALLGNAAHSIHPNAAQGLNLCLRDAFALAQTLRHGAAQGIAVDKSRLLQSYLKQRRTDQTRVIRFSHWLASLYYSPALAKRVLRQKLLLLFAYNRWCRQHLGRNLSGITALQAGGIWHESTP